MSDDTERDDRALGAALSRAIDTQAPGETPFERSRLAKRIAQPRRVWGGTWLPVGAAVALVATVALAAAVLGGRGNLDRVAAPDPTPTSTASPARAPQPTPTPAVAPDRDQIVVYMSREGLPPVGMTVRTVLSRPIDLRIADRVTALFTQVTDADVPAGSRNFAALFAQGAGAPTIRARVEGDVATVEFGTSFATRTKAEEEAFVAQLVFTASEEPGIHGVRLTGPGGRPLGLRYARGGVVDDRPLIREAVAGFAWEHASQQVIQGGEAGVGATTNGFAGWRASVDEVAPGLARLVVELIDAPRGRIPQFSVRAERLVSQVGSGSDGAWNKWALRLDLPEVLWAQRPGEPFHCCPLLMVERTPLQRVSVAPVAGGHGNDRNIAIFMQLSDLRPWRVAILQQPLRIVVDIGGPPASVSEAIAVHSPVPGSEVERTFTVRGMARTFEANVQWRLRDSNGRAITTGFTTASVGTSALWGTFETTVTAPPGTRGNVLLEVFEISARDGSEIHKVAIPVRIR